jgi:glutaredoxin 2
MADTILTAEQFYETVIAPNNADKSFLVPSWAISFAEKYADYLAVQFYRLKLEIEISKFEQNAKNTFKEIEKIQTNGE